MENTLLIANSLNLAFYKTMTPLSFIKNSNWELFEKVINEAKASGISFQIQTNEFYDLSSFSILETVIEIYANLELIKSKKMDVVKMQDFQKAVELREEELTLIKKIKEIDIKEFYDDFIFFKPIQISTIQINQFKNKSFNYHFLKNIGLNI